MSISKTEVIFDVLSDGVVLFGPTGAARYVNRAAREAFGVRVETLYTDERVQHALGRLRSGDAKLPLVCDVDFARDGELVALRVTILDWKAGGGYTFVIAGASGRPGDTHDLPATFELINRELGAPIRAFVEATADLPPALAQAGRELAERLARLNELTEVFGPGSILTDDRVVLAELVEEAWDELAALAAKRHVRVVTQRIDRDLPPVYGGRKWLKRAVTEIMMNAIAHGGAGRDAEAPAVVEATASVDAGSLVLTVVNRGMGIGDRIGGRQTLPFVKNPRRAPSSGTPGLGIGLPLVLRIAELHGGTLSVDDSEPERVRVVLRLPTGERPQTPRRDTGLEQAQRYAHDLAKLLARRARRDLIDPARHPADTARTA